MTSGHGSSSNPTPTSTVSATTTGQQRPIDVENALRLSRNSFAFQPQYTTPSFPSSGGRIFIVATSKSPNEEENSIMSRNDLAYLLKLGAGSIAGTAAIKYGSILVP